MKKIIRISTIPLSLNIFCRGLLAELSRNYEVVAISSPGCELDEIVKREKIRTIGIPMQRQISPLRDLLSLIRLIRVFRKEKPDMVHSMTPKAGLLSMMAAMMVRIPVRVHTFTGLVFPTATGLKRRLLMLTDRVTCACATHILAEGKGVLNDLKRYRLTSKKLSVLGNGNVRGIDLAYYDRTPEVVVLADNIRAAYGIGTDDFTFIFVGRIVRDKGINELVSAFCRLTNEHPHIHLLLVGDEDAGLDSIAEQTRLRIATTPNIHSEGWQKDVRPWYAAADALAFPSYREGFPNVVIEAGAMGLPSIVTDINGSREIIHDRVNGVIVPSQSEERLYKAMRAFVEHEHSRKEMAANSRRMVAERYEQGYVRQCLMDFYQSILQ